ncbi:acyltransferase family protein [Actinomadura fulvescens]|uniref:Acyltransferase family protein n=1 Tax=Actinomadura fulvescens TaxID=46160 RepID=A0ABN3QDX6_9ACTN
MAASAGRDPYFDNAKFLAILLVVAGHAVEDLRDVPAVRAAYLLVYLFHMPVFIMLTGYLSRRFTFSGGKARKLIGNLAAPYVIFEILYSVYFWSVSGGKPLEITLLRSSYVMWFLMALFFWRLSTPVWQQIRWPLGVAMGISLLSYMTALPKELTLHRLLGLLPFYVLGLMLRPEHFEPLKTARARLVGAAAMCGALIVLATAGRELNNSWIYWEKGHEALGLSNVEGTVMRTGLLLAGTALAFAFLAMVPARRTWFTPLGATTLYAYLLHGFGIQVLRKTGVYDISALHSVASAAVVAVVAAMIATVLCGRPVVRATRWLIEPRIDWIFTGLTYPAKPDQHRPVRVKR